MSGCVHCTGHKYNGMNEFEFNTLRVFKYNQLKMMNKLKIKKTNAKDICFEIEEIYQLLKCKIQEIPTQ